MRIFTKRQYNPDYDTVEKQCTDCGEWWPDDKEFFPTTGHGKTANQCKACYMIRRRGAGNYPSKAVARGMT